MCRRDGKNIEDFGYVHHCNTADVEESLLECGGGSGHASVYSFANTETTKFEGVRPNQKLVVTVISTSKLYGEKHVLGKVSLQLGSLQA